MVTRYRVNCITSSSITQQSKKLRGMRTFLKAILWCIKKITCIVNVTSCFHWFPGVNLLISASAHTANVTYTTEACRSNYKNQGFTDPCLCSSNWLPEKGNLQCRRNLMQFSDIFVKKMHILYFCFKTSFTSYGKNK